MKACVFLNLFAAGDTLLYVGMFEHTKHITMHVYRGDLSLWDFFSKSEANTSELLENRKEMFTDNSIAVKLNAIKSPVSKGLK